MAQNNQAHAVLEVNPESALQFILTRTDTSGSSNSAPSDADGNSNSIPRCVITIRNPDTSTEHLAFKVKTTQPRRYLVRPNQGVIPPGKSETIAIIIVEKDRQNLLETYDRLGQSALDHSKDKFLVQSCVVSKEFASKFIDKQSETEGGNSLKLNKELAETLTSMWNEAVSNPSTLLSNKKLHVKHIVSDSSKTEEVASTALPTTSASAIQPSLQRMERTSLEGMSHEQVLLELSKVHRKYDELVSFSVNLTAERDILNNALEKTKRDLQQEMAARVNSGNKDLKMQQRQMNSEAGFTFSMMNLIAIGIACLIAGMKIGKDGYDAKILEAIPFLSLIL